MKTSPDQELTAAAELEDLQAKAPEAVVGMEGTQGAHAETSVPYRPASHAQSWDAACDIAEAQTGRSFAVQRHSIARYASPAERSLNLLARQFVQRRRAERGETDKDHPNDTGWYIGPPMSPAERSIQLARQPCTPSAAIAWTWAELVPATQLPSSSATCVRS
jgi:hypothetical protein